MVVFHLYCWIKRTIILSMILEANVANRACFVTLTFCQVFLCILSVILYTRTLYNIIIGLLLYDVQQAWTQHNKHAVLPKKIVILHPNLPITATSPQQALSSVPKMAIVKRFSCIYITIFFLLKLYTRCY